MKQRIITAIVLIIITLPCVYLGGIFFEIFCAIASILAMYEILKLTNRSKINRYVVDIFMYIFALYVIIFEKNLFVSSFYFILMIVVLFALSIIFEEVKFDDVCLLASFGFFVICGVHAIYYVRMQEGIAPLLFIVLATYGSDTGAYFAGVAFGKHKLIPRLSPKKTVEGSIGGIVLGTIAASIFSYFNPLPISFGASVLVAFVLTITAQIGDLTFSSLKRTKGIKDFSNLLPGHGGVLDRLDSLTFNTLVFCLFLYCL